MLLGACLWPYITGDNSVFQRNKTERRLASMVCSFQDYIPGIFTHSVDWAAMNYL